MSPRSASAQAVLIESHEGRLQRVEGEVTDLTGSVARVEAGVEYLKESLQASMTMVTDKLCDLETLTKEHSAASAAKQQAILDRVNAIEKAKEADEKADAIELATSVTRWAILKKAAIPLTIAGTAILVKLGDWLWTLLSGAL